ncbi:hypothetical protein [Vibrio japonicus]|uniref:Uncharacterized protein n=1 Tax=Vibrio japonicus TaxID=1824638 RepID=A0ABY5LQG6_9VIBR|nr:hypothetical protein [Vibrio japonicus]UUM32959.1 hypothetical protein NP165_15515 [Vibrio japonicus]
MNHELGSAYLGQMIAKQAMHEAMTKPKAKKASFFKRMMKKVAK